MAAAVKNVYQLIGEAMKKIGAIGKDSVATNNAGKRMYNFRGIDAVYNALNPVMAELGLFICPKVLEQTREERKTVNGGTLIYTILTVEYTVWAPDGSSITMVVAGEGMDSGDKSTNKAMSAAMKYAMFQLFMIPTEEMSDPDSEVHEEIVPREPMRVPPAQANVTITNKVPEKPVSEAQKHINNEIAFMSQRLGISDKKEMSVWFASKRKALINANVIPDIKSDDMTLEQAKKLTDAIYDTFLTDNPGVKIS